MTGGCLLKVLFDYNIQQREIEIWLLKQGYCLIKVTTSAGLTVIQKFFQVNVPNAQSVLSEAIKETSSVADIFYAFFALKNLGLSGWYRVVNCK